MSIPRFKYLFAQFVNKTATADETSEFLSMMKNGHYDREITTLLDELWHQTVMDSDLKEEKAEQIFNLILGSDNSKKRKRRGIISLWVKSIAAVLILSGISYLFFKEQVHISSSTSNKAARNVGSKHEKRGRRLIALPDGSSVILNENSKLEFDNFSKNGKREVKLIGEAYFDIAHDKLRPFVVHTGKLQTTVLGTAFNIKTSLDNQTIVVTVTRGKVKVGDSDQTYNVLVPDEQAIFNAEQVTHVKKVVNAQDFTTWTTGDLYFDDVTMKEVASQLQARFNISIVFSNESVKNCRFSATFLKTQSLEQILNIIGEFNNIRYHFQNNHTIALSGPGCAETPLTSLNKNSNN